MLSVLRDAAEAAEGAAREGGGLAEVSAAALREGRASLARTRALLPELNAAGVVDAGGKGVVLLLDAIHGAVAGVGSSERVGPPGPVGRERPAPGRGPLRFSFEVQYLLEAEDGEVASLRSGLGAVGDSLVVVGGGGLFTVHVHTDQPGKAVELAEDAGRPRDISIVDLREQVGSCAGAPARAVRQAERACAMVAVAEGRGLVRAFRSLGAEVVEGGPGRDPSLEGLIRALDAAAAPGVVILPNHPSAVSAAREAAEATSKRARVVEARSIPSGLAAAAAFNPEVGLEENVESMEESSRTCRAGEIARAEGDGRTPGGPARAGRWVGTVDGEAVGGAMSLADAARAILARMLWEGAEVVTIVEGADAGPRDRATVAGAVREAVDGLALDVLQGDQPQYPFLIGVE